MRTNLSSGSKKLLLILTLLLGGISASAVTFGDSILPFGLARGGSFLAQFSEPPAEFAPLRSAAAPLAIGYNKGVYNKDDFPPDSTGDWTTGNAGQHYLESQWVSYQYQVAGITGTTPDFDVKFNHFQQNVNAIFIDAFANFRACVDCTEDSFTSGPKKGMLLDDVPFPRTDTTNWKSAISAISFINGTLDSSGQCVENADAVNAPSQEHCFSVDGSQLQALFPGVNFASGSHTITLFYEAHLSTTRTWKNGKQYLLGCSSSIHYAAPGPEVVPADTIYGTDAYSAGDPCTLDTGDWTGSFKGVGFATGSSRHFNIINQTAGSNGGLSLPIPTVPEPTGTVTIVKVTDPSPAVGTFGFTGDFGPFDLDTDPNTANPSSITFTEVPGNIPFSVTEASVPLDWDLTNIVCTVSTGGTESTDLGTATATVTLPSTEGASATCTFTNTRQTASLTLTKTPDVTDVCNGSNSPVTYTYVVTNTGTAPLTVNISDNLLGDIDGGPGFALPAGASQTFTKSTTLSATTTNTATVTGVSAGGQQATATARATVTGHTCTIDLTKTPSVTDICNGTNTSVTYTYVVTNTGNFFNVSGSVTDNVLGNIGSFGPLAPGGSATLTKTTTISATTTNTGTATGTFTDSASTIATDTANATITARTCTISLTKSPDITQVCEGANTQVTYTYVVTNTGDFFSVSGSITDNILGSIGNFGPLAPGASATLTKVATINATTVNTGTATGTFTDSTPTTKSATATATVTAINCGRSQLVPTGNECPSFVNRTAPDLVMAANSSGNIAPGQFFYYTELSIAGQTTFQHKVGSTPDSAADPLINTMKVFDTSCNNISSSFTLNSSGNVATYSGNLGAGARKVIVRTGYSSPRGVAGTIFTFETYLNGLLQGGLSESITVQ